MKTLSLLITLMFLCALNAIAQDTIKAAKSDTLTTRQKLRKYGPHPAVSDFLAPPQVRMRKHQHADSVLNAIAPEHHHPGIYLDFGFGAAFLGIHGLEGHYSLNYETKSNLFTFRGLGTVTLTDQYTALSPFTYLPDYKTSNSLGEYALMYGRRFINDKHKALSVSLGISSDRRTFYYYYPQTPTVKTNAYYAGLPFEANYNWFTGRFGVGFGVKLMGDISKYSFLGLGIDMSLGFHKSH